MSTVSEIVARALARHVDYVFGLMGNGNAFVVGEFERSAVPFVPVRHEAATVASADAYYRVARRLAVATTTYGPGFTNAITPLAEAAKAEIPLIYVIGDQPTDGPRFIDIDQLGVARSIGVETIYATQRNAGPAAIQAVELALSTSQPVILAIPYDLAEADVTEAGADIPEPTEREKPVAGEGDANKVAQFLAGAQRPLIVAGRGARMAREEVRELATTLAAHTIATAPTRGFFADGDGYLDLGVLGGFASPGSAATARAADVVLVLGAGLNQFTMAFGNAFGPDATVIQVDTKPLATHQRVDHFVRSDVSAFTRRLLERVSPAQREMEPVDTSFPTGPEHHSDGRLDPRPLLARIDKALPKDKLVALDGGNFIGWNTYLSLHNPDELVLVGTAFMSIGLGFPSAPGVIAAAGERTTVLVTGDGGGIMGIADLETFIRTTHSGVVIIMNDAAYGAEIHQYRHLGVPEAPMSFGEVDFAGMARALGARASVVKNHADLREFEEWDRRGTFVLDCRITPEMAAPWLEEVRAQQDTSV